MFLQCYLTLVTINSDIFRRVHVVGRHTYSFLERHHYLIIKYPSIVVQILLFHHESKYYKER